VLGWVERLGRYADVSVHLSAQVTAGVVVYRLDERLIFTNASYCQARITEAIAGTATPTTTVVFDAEGVDDIDASGGGDARTARR
jgi:sulfate permease, SulP family